MSKKKLIRVLFLIVLLQFEVYHTEFIKGAIRIIVECALLVKKLMYIILFG